MLPWRLQYNKMKKLFTIIGAAFCAITLNAQQNWVELMNKPDANFYEIQQAFNEYWKDKDIHVPGNGYKPFKRWEHFVERRVFPSGDLSLLAKTGENFDKFLKEYNLGQTASGNAKFSQNNMIASSTWTAVGPMGAMTGSATNGLPRKAGRDNFITFHPTDLNTFWVGAPAGGLWKTTNNGSSWTILNESWNVTGCTDLAVDPSNPNILYLATGDGFAGDTRSIGVLKSTDGGVTWNTTGLTAAVASNFRIRRLIIHPTNPQILICAANNGVWRTINGGTNWTQEVTGDFFDVEFRPGNPTVVYAGSNLAFFRSTDTGDNFTMISNGIPTSGSNRLNLAVTPHDANYVYVLRSNTSSGFGGLYRSVDGGTTFSVMSTSPDVLANSCSGSSGGGQGWYDLAMAISPTNKDIVVVGGVNHWRSTNGGSTWTCIGCWNSTVANPPYIHADVHDLDYRSDGVLYSANDGGIYFHTGTAWTDITATRNIAQIYRIGTSALTANRWITGHQDNGSNLYTGTAYIARYPGDGMDCFIDWANDNNMFASTPNGGHVRSTNGGASWSAANSGISQAGNWVTPYKQDPTVSTTIYSGRTALWKSTNSGVSWTALAATGGSGAMIEFAIAPSNNQVIYVLHSGSIRKTTNGGTSWTNVTGTVPLGSAAPEFIAVKPTDPNTAWVVLSGYSAGNKVFKTTNGGTSWTNVSFNLPNLPANCVVFEPGSNDRVYVGMDVGVYYIEGTSTSWTLYNTGLPNTPVSDMEISPANPGKLVAATYGRGTWIVDLASAMPPVTSFSASSSPLCNNNAIQFNSNSVNGATSWSWSVTPSAGVSVNTFTSQSPIFNFANTGNYTLSVQASNSAGPGNISSQTVIILPSPVVNVSATTQTVCAGSPATITASGASTYSWSNGGGTSATAVFTPAANSVYTVTGTGANGCKATRTSTVNTLAQPNVVITGTNILCIGSSATLSASGASSYTWNTSSNAASIVVSPTVNTTYTVTGTGANGCKKSATLAIGISPLPSITASSASSIICMGETTTLTASGGVSYTWNPGNTSGNNLVAGPASNTTYTVTGVNANGCANTGTVSLTVSACTGLLTINGETVSYAVYPNPAHEKVMLNINIKASAEINVEVLDAQGKRLKDLKLNVDGGNNQHQIDITEVATGIYFLKLSTAKEELKIIKLVKE